MKEVETTGEVPPSGEENSPENLNTTQNQTEEEKKKKNEKVKALKKKNNVWRWPIRILIITLVLSFSVSVFSEFVLSRTGLVVSIIMLIPLLALAVITDMIGVAVAAADIYPFRSMASRKVRGAKESIYLIKNAEKVSSICNDVVGDVCGIVSGAIGATIVVKIVTDKITSTEQVFIAAAVSAVIAGLTIFGKAVAKRYAINQSTKIISACGKFLSIFTKKIK